MNGNKLNTVSAIWGEDPKTVSDETYSEFYKYIANAFDEPLDKLHYRADAPLDIKALFFIPSFHSEKVSLFVCILMMNIISVMMVVILKLTLMVYIVRYGSNGTKCFIVFQEGHD